MGFTVLLLLLFTLLESLLCDQEETILSLVSSKVENNVTL